MTSKRTFGMNKEQRRKRQEELLQLFDGDYYQEKFIDGSWHVKSFNGNTKRWQVGIYSKESFDRYKRYMKFKNNVVLTTLKV